MTRYLLDTDVLINFSNRREPALSRILSWIDARETVGVCAITVAEFAAGLTEVQLSAWKEFLDSLPYWDIGAQAAMRAGQDRYSYARQGHTIGITDCLIAAVARQEGAILVTRNERHYPMLDAQMVSLLPPHE